MKNGVVRPGLYCYQEKLKKEEMSLWLVVTVAFKMSAKNFQVIDRD